MAYAVYRVTYVTFSLTPVVHCNTKYVFGNNVSKAGVIVASARR